MSDEGAIAADVERQERQGATRERLIAVARAVGDATAAAPPIPGQRREGRVMASRAHGQAEARPSRIKGDNGLRDGQPGAVEGAERTASKTAHDGSGLGAVGLEVPAAGNHGGDQDGRGHGRAQQPEHRGKTVGVGDQAAEPGNHHR